MLQIFQLQETDSHFKWYGKHMVTLIVKFFLRPQPLQNLK